VSGAQKGTLGGGGSKKCKSSLAMSTRCRARTAVSKYLHEIRKAKKKRRGSLAKSKKRIEKKSTHRRLEESLFSMVENINTGERRNGVWQIEQT